MQLQHGKNNTQQYIFGDFVLKTMEYYYSKTKNIIFHPKNLALSFYYLMLTVKLLAKKRLSIRSGARVLLVMNL